MNDGIKPVRRVVTGVDAQGRSKVLIDSAAPGVKANTFKKGTGMTDIWLWDECPAPLSGERDDGNVPFHFEPPGGGSRVCGRCSVSRTPLMRAGVRSVTQMRVAVKPGRAGSLRTSGDGPSAMALDLSFSSMTTMRRTGLVI